MAQKHHWMASPNKNYLGSSDLPENEDLILTIKTAGWEDVENPATQKSEPKKVIRFEEEGIKPFIVNQTNSKNIISSTGKKYMEDTIGMKIALYIDTFVDRKTKEEMDVVRVRPKLVIKPELLPGTKEWEAVVIALKNGYTIDQVETKYRISEQNKEVLFNEAI